VTLAEASTTSGLGNATQAEQGKHFTSAHIDVAWLGAQCCLPHERKLEREMRE